MFSTQCYGIQMHSQYLMQQSASNKVSIKSEVHWAQSIIKNLFLLPRLKKGPDGPLSRWLDEKSFASGERMKDFNSILSLVYILTI